MCRLHPFELSADVELVAAALLSAFGGLVVFEIFYMDRTAGKKGWRWYVEPLSYRIDEGVLWSAAGSTFSKASLLS